MTATAVAEPSGDWKDKSPTLSAKFGSGLSVTTANESFKIQINGRVQSRVEVGHLYDSDEKAELGAQVRRARLKVSGFVGKGKTGPDDIVPGKYKLKYNVQLGLSNGDISGISEGRGVLLDAYFDYAPCDHLTVRFGQTKLPGNREFLTSSQSLQFVDRGVTSDFRLDRDFGLQLHGDFGNNFIFRPAIAISTGEGRNITAMEAGGLSYTFRTELLPLGKFKNDKGQFTGGDVDREPEPKLALAAAYDFNHNARFERGQRGGTEVAPDDRASLHTVFADALFKFKGLSLSGEYARRMVDEDARGDYRTGQAVTAGAGYVCKKKFEVAARYQRSMPLDNLDAPEGSKAYTNAYTLALSKYFIGHNLKVQTDYTLFDETEGGEGNDNQLSGQWRLQVEVAF